MLTLWSTDEWLREATSWLDGRLAATGARRIGAVTQPHLRPWGTVLTAPTSHGPVWLKAPSTENAFEIPLYALLRRVGSTAVLQPIAVDVERGWVLLPDGGATLGVQLGDRVGTSALSDALVTILPAYGRLQRELAPHVDELLTAGIADMRAPVMLQRFDEAVDAVGGRVDAAGWETLGRVRGRRELFGEWCARLAAASVPASVDHNDLHPWNILADGTPRFYDWGDSVIAHPFASMLLGLGYLHEQLGVDVDDPAITRPRDAYLEVFSDLAPHAELVRELELACQLGKVARALTWDRSLRAQGYDQAGEFATAPLNCLATLLTDTHLASI